MRRCFSNGFTLVEILITIALIGVLATMLIPVLFQNVGQEKFMDIAKNSASALGQGYATLLSETPSTADTTAQTIALKMDHVRRISNGSTSTQLQNVTNTPANGTCLQAGASSCALFRTPCDATTPCLLLNSGGVLQYDSTAKFAPTGQTPGLNTHAVRFIMDPDADGPQPAISLMLFFGGRITTRRFASSAILTNDRLPESVTDPDYILPWTNG